MILKPLAGYILIEPVDEEEVTASGLVMPDKEKEKPSKGKVVAISEVLPRFDSGATYDQKTDQHKIPNEICPVKVGNIVIYHKWAGQDVKEDNKEYRLVQFKDLMGVYEKE